MKFHAFKRPQALALAASLCVAGVFAQTAPRVTDVAPAPAEERTSVGAVVLDKSLAQARRTGAFADSGARTGVTSVGGGAVRTTLHGQARSDLATAQRQEAAGLHRHGAGSLTEK